MDGRKKVDGRGSGGKIHKIGEKLTEINVICHFQCGQPIVLMIIC